MSGCGGKNTPVFALVQCFVLFGSHVHTHTHTQRIFKRTCFDVSFCVVTFALSLQELVAASQPVLHGSVLSSQHTQSINVIALSAT